MIRPGLNRAYLRDVMRPAHDQVDDVFSTYISSHPSKPQALCDFLNIMQTFWNENFKHNQWCGAKALDDDLIALGSCVSPKDLQKKTPPFLAVQKLSLEYLFWGSAMGSRKLKHQFTDAIEGFECGYFEVLIHQHQHHWQEINAQIEALDEQQLHKMGVEITQLLKWLALFIQNVKFEQKALSQRGATH